MTVSQFPRDAFKFCPHLVELLSQTDQFVATFSKNLLKITDNC